MKRHQRGKSSIQEVNLKLEPINSGSKSEPPLTVEEEKKKSVPSSHRPAPRPPPRSHAPGPLWPLTWLSLLQLSSAQHPAAEPSWWPLAPPPSGNLSQSFWKAYAKITGTNLTENSETCTTLSVAGLVKKMWKQNEIISCSVLQQTSCFGSLEVLAW